MPMIGARFYTQLDALQSKCDLQEDELAKEMENGRLYRLMVKLGTINERPEWVDIINKKNNSISSLQIKCLPAVVIIESTQFIAQF